MLRNSIFEILLELSSFNEIEIKNRIWDLLEDEGCDVDKNEWNHSVDLLSFVDETNSETIMLSAARIIYRLDLEGLDIVGSGLIEDDSEWERFESRLENE